MAVERHVTRRLILATATTSAMPQPACGGAVPPTSGEDAVGPQEINTWISLKQNGGLDRRKVPTVATVLGR